MLDLLIHDRTRFGAGAVRDLPSFVGEAGGSRAFVVTDPGVVRSGVVDRVVRRLAAAGLETTVFDGVEANPGTVSVERGSA
ncbi:MAG: iron-containing alcohol dehydrogenase, partial [Chloroflexota bacterium]